MPLSASDDDVLADGDGSADPLNDESLPYADWLNLRNAQIAGAGDDPEAPGNDDLVVRPGDPPPVRENLPLTYDTDTGRFTTLSDPGAVADATPPPSADVSGDAAGDGDSDGDNAGAYGVDAMTEGGAAPSPGQLGAGAQSDVAGAIAAAQGLGALFHKIRGPARETPTSDNPVARWAEAQVGGDGYGRLDVAPDAQSRRDILLRRVDQQGRLEPKCNQFVWDALKAGGVPASRMSDGHIPVAKEWGDPGSKIGGYEPVSGPPRPGDVVSNGEHVAIFAPLKDGSPGTVSAASPWPLSPDAGVTGGVVHNRWGFRGDEGNIVVWRAVKPPA